MQICARRQILVGCMPDVVTLKKNGSVYTRIVI